MELFQKNYNVVNFFKSGGKSKCRLCAISVMSGDLTFALLNPDLS